MSTGRYSFLYKQKKETRFLLQFRRPECIYKEERRYNVITLAICLKRKMAFSGSRSFLGVNLAPVVFNEDLVFHCRSCRSPLATSTNVEGEVMHFLPFGRRRLALAVSYLAFREVDGILPTTDDDGYVSSVNCICGSEVGLRLSIPPEPDLEYNNIILLPKANLKWRFINDFLLHDFDV